MCKTKVNVIGSTRKSGLGPGRCRTLPMVMRPQKVRCLQSSVMRWASSTLSSGWQPCLSGGRIPLPWQLPTILTTSGYGTRHHVTLISVMMRSTHWVPHWCSLGPALWGVLPSPLAPSGGPACWQSATCPQSPPSTGLGTLKGKSPELHYLQLKGWEVKWSNPQILQLLPPKHEDALKIHFKSCWKFKNFNILGHVFIGCAYFLLHFCTIRAISNTWFWVRPLYFSALQLYSGIHSSDLVMNQHLSLAGSSVLPHSTHSNLTIATSP